MKKLRYLYKAFLIIVVFILFSTSCTKEDFSTIEPYNEDSIETRQIIDQKGRTITLPKEINRVVTTYLPATNIVFAVGGQSKLVGVNDGINKNKFLTSVYTDIANVSEVGNKKGVNLEEIIASNPDVVIMFPTNDSEVICEQLMSQGIPAVVIEPESIEKIRESFRLVGDILGCNEQAQDIVKYYDETLSIIDERLGSIPLEERKRIYLAGGNGILSTSSRDMYQHFVIEKAGGIDVASSLIGGWNHISAEQLIQWNPDIIVAVQYCSEGMPDMIKENPQLKSIKAVRNNELYRFPSNLGPWDFPAPRSILGILWLAKTIYPNKFDDIVLKYKIDEFHTNFYGKSFTELGGILDDRGISSR